MEMLVETAPLSRKRHYSSLVDSCDVYNTKKTCFSWAHSAKENISNYQREHEIKQGIKEHQTEEQMDVTDSIPKTLDCTLKQSEVTNMYASSSYRRSNNTVHCSRCQAGEPGHFNHQKMF
ncbi:uncharacterized protein LOC110242842 [Exaiptasia diaphana]|uniref:Uncharacterized protein n=1 Tax=Exaiptasia diaphana TaxID=2652724 RepID=A0A913XHV8_EXADI|nr:uncharacterized protein LOC110242842 [Exaiptasia diaphana]KXJ11993.1 hypothetical protein AC249_AIPGENE6013 [Exaiptasia diaphana]